MMSFSTMSSDKCILCGIESKRFLLYQKGSSFHTTWNLCSRYCWMMIPNMQFFTLCFSTDDTFSLRLRSWWLCQPQLYRYFVLSLLCVRLCRHTNWCIVFLQDAVIRSKWSARFWNKSCWCYRRLLVESDTRVLHEVLLFRFNFMFVSMR